MDQAAAVAETERLLPGLVEAMDPEHPGMHRTDTVDLIYVLSDACALELDGGEIVKLKEGDTIVLNGPRPCLAQPTYGILQPADRVAGRSVKGLSEFSKELLSVLPTSRRGRG